LADWAYQDDNREEFISGYNNLLGIRTQVAGLINGTAAEIAITDNVTNGMSYVANGITLQAGDEIVTTDQEHGGGLGGFRRRPQENLVQYLFRRCRRRTGAASARVDLQVGADRVGDFQRPRQVGVTNDQVAVGQ
jgi:hypothetical protein